MMKKIPIYLATLVLLGSLAACQAKELSSPTPLTLPATERISTETALPTPAPTADSALNAVLQEVEGSVEAKDIVETAFRAAEDGRIVQEEGEVRTLDDGYTRVDLSSGTLIRMAPLSYFTLISNEVEDDSLVTLIKLEVGKVWVVLNGGSLEVETSSGQAAVRGSYMMVEINPETQETLITCLEGHCELHNPAWIVELVDGQRAKLQPPDLTGGEFTVPPIEKMNERDFAEWLLFAPEAQNIFPLLDEEGILPLADWEGILPEDGSLPNLDELFPEIDLLDPPPLLDGDGTLLDGEGLPDGSNLPNGGGVLPDGGGLPDEGGDRLPLLGG